MDAGSRPTAGVGFSRGCSSLTNGAPVLAIRMASTARTMHSGVSGSDQRWPLGKKEVKRRARKAVRGAAKSSLGEWSSHSRVRLLFFCPVVSAMLLTPSLPCSCPVNIDITLGQSSLGHAPAPRGQPGRPQHAVRAEDRSAQMPDGGTSSCRPWTIPKLPHSARGLRCAVYGLRPRDRLGAGSSCAGADISLGRTLAANRPGSET